MTPTAMANGTPEVSDESGQNYDSNIYITGIAGTFPESESVKELSDNLFNKIDMVTDDNRRWTDMHPEIPHRVGKIKTISKFDASFFETSTKEAHCTDPMQRIIMEKVYECLIDAGMNPEEIRNTQTGVFTGCLITETIKTWEYQLMPFNELGITGCGHFMLANRISQWLGLTGPSYNVDTACSSSFYALENAYAAIKDGRCDAAIVCGANLTLHPSTSLIFARLGVLSADGKCKSFDESANGYVRSEGITACFLQKAKDSRRAYARLVHAKTNCDGFKSNGINFPASRVQQKLLEEFYGECDINPETVEYVEAHATGTRVGDPEETLAIDAIFCKNRKKPLLIGTIKSNLGHGEATAGMNSLAKAIIAYNTGYIAPNINFENPRKDIAALMEGRAKVVTEKTPWNRGLFALNSFGFGGANAHVLLENVPRLKVSNGLPADNLPRLVCVSGRTKSAVSKILNDLESRTVDVDEIRLWHAIFKKSIRGHLYRGFVLLESTPNGSVRLARNIDYTSSKPTSVCFKYSSLQLHWREIAEQLMTIPVFAAAIQRCALALKPKDLNLIKIIKEAVGQENKYLLIGSVAVGIGLTDVLKLIGFQPDYIISQDFGELCCAYADGGLTPEQTILTAYQINKSIENINTSSSVVSEQIKELFSSKFAEQLLQSLKTIIPLPKPRSTRWISQRNMPSEKYLSAEYLVRSLQNPIKDVSSYISSDTIVIEIGLDLNSQGFSIVKENTNALEYIFTSLGKLYILGLNQNLAELYPAVQFPVPQTTPMLSHLVEWDHNDNWYTPCYNTVEKLEGGERQVKIVLGHDEYEYITGHVIDGRVIYPGTGYLILIWETLALMTSRYANEVSIVFEDVSFLRATNFPKDGTVEFNITVQSGTGNFEITENRITVVTGRAYEKKDVGKEFRAIPETEDDKSIKYRNDLNTKDFYKELNIRGYQYKGQFRGVRCSNIEGTKGSLLWTGNWVTFLDTMLQIQIVSNDSRSLYVPTRIERIAIDVDLHQSKTKQEPIEIQSTSEKTIAYDCYPNLQLIRAGGVEIRGLHITAISKKPPLGIPVYEKNEFLPNRTENISIQDAIRANMQLILENIPVYKCKSIELVDEEYKTNNIQPIIETVGNVLADLPLVQAELVVLTEETLSLPSNITVANKKVSTETNALLFIAANLLSRPNVLEEGFKTLKSNCFILSRENTRPNQKDCPSNYNIITIHGTDGEYLVLLNKKNKPQPTKYIKVVTEDNTYAWIEETKKEINNGSRIVLYNENEPCNGLLGLVNCLRKEPGGENIYGVLIADPSAPKFDPYLDFYKNQLDLSLGSNVYKSGQWGTYRHLLLEQQKDVPAIHAYLKPTVMGDLGSLRFLEGPLSAKGSLTSGDKTIVHVYCSALNFRDAMTSMGRVTVESVARGRLDQECVQGLEVSGKLSNGSRVMGICRRGITNLAQTDPSLIWNVPDEWSLIEAASVPVAYGTVYMSLVMMGKMQKGESILIHAGTGAVGQAAINVALHHGLEVFTTVSTPAKRAFIKRVFPQMKDSHIGQSRDTTFEEIIRRETNGKGVDLVLNSLADEKLQASAKCLKLGGRFLEIGKYDITINTKIETCFLNKGVSFFGVMLDYIYEKEAYILRQNISKLVEDGIRSGAVRPITYCTFEKHEIEKAFRYIAAGKHVGKVVIKIRDEEPSTRIVKPTLMPLSAIPRYMCHEDYVYVIIGGLGGFGLELGDWLVMRGARKLLFSSRRGVTNGYQALRIKFWHEYDAQIEVSTADVTTESGCKELLVKAAAMGPVRAIFNLAVILKDAVFSNQTPETFQTSFGPKAQTTMNLDKLSRIFCPELQDFVIFSSVSCGRGNAGQTNYGFSNSVMERICEERKREGLPALAIQWGAVGDVGLVADMQEENIQLEIGGTLQQRISSCLDAVDLFLKQDAAIVSSIVVAEKKVGGSGSNNVVDVVAGILGIHDIKTISRQVPLSEMGMDSVMAVEIKQTLERDYELFFNAQEIRMLTFAKLIELTAANSDPASDEKNPNVDDSLDVFRIMRRNFGDEKRINDDYILLPSLASHTQDEKDTLTDSILFLLPGLESSGEAFRELCSKLKMKTVALQLGLEEQNSIECMSDKIYKIVKDRLTRGGTFALLGYSYGATPILESAARLEKDGYKGIVYCIDGSPEFTIAILKELVDFNKDDEIQKHIILRTFNLISSSGEELNQKLDIVKTFEERLKFAIDFLPANPGYSNKFLMSMATACYNRLKLLTQYNFNNIKKIQSPIVLIRQEKIPPTTQCNEVYGLDKFTDSPVSTYYINCDHTHLIEREECAHIINSTLKEFYNRPHGTKVVEDIVVTKEKPRQVGIN